MIAEPCQLRLAGVGLSSATQCQPLFKAACFPRLLVILLSNLLPHGILSYPFLLNFSASYIMTESIFLNRLNS